MWQTTSTAHSTASRAEIFARYRDTTSWPEWDGGVKSVSLDGPFQVGTSGTLVPASGPKVRFTMTEVVENRAYTNVTRLPGATMTFAHTLDDASDGRTAITHTATVEGPLSVLFAFLIGRGIARDLPNAVQALADVAVPSREA